MPNQNSPHGFAILAQEQSNAFNAQCHMYAISSADNSNTYSIGDVVASAAAGADASNPWGTFGISFVTKPTGAPNVAAIPRGVIVSVFRNPFNLDTVYVPQVKAANYYVLVCDDPYVVMEAIPDGTNAYDARYVNSNTGFNQSAVNAATLSNSTVASIAGGSLPQTTSTLPLKILGVAQRPNVSTGLYVPLVVMFNTHELKSVGTAGV